MPGSSTSWDSSASRGSRRPVNKPTHNADGILCVYALVHHLSNNTCTSDLLPRAAGIIIAGGAPGRAVWLHWLVRNGPETQQHQTDDDEGEDSR
jgi:hypothetical protein